MNLYVILESVITCRIVFGIWWGSALGFIDCRIVILFIYLFIYLIPVWILDKTIYAAIFYAILKIACFRKLKSTLYRMFKKCFYRGTIFKFISKTKFFKT